MKKLVYTLLVLFVVGLIGTAASLTAAGGFSLDALKIHDEKIVEDKNINKLEVDLASNDVNIYSTDDDKITVELNGKMSKKIKDDYKLDVKTSGNTLKVGLDGEDNWKFNIGIIIKDINIDIYLPQKVYEAINVKMASGDVVIQDLKARDFSILANSGDISAENLIAHSELKIHVDSGDVKINDNQAETFDIETTSGDIEASGGNAKESMFHVTSGDMRIANIKGDVTANANSGDISIRSGETLGDISVEVTSGDVDIAYDKKPDSLSINYKGTSGDGNIDLDGVSYEEKSEDKIIGKIGTGQYKLEVRTTSGDFNLR